MVGESRNSFQCFFRWLHSALLRVEEDPGGTVAPTMMSQQEIKFIAEFLDKFDSGDEDKGVSNVESFTHKHLERVRQYLRMGDLEQPAERRDNFWHSFLRENPHVAEIEGVIRPSHKSSLALEKELLKVG